MKLTALKLFAGVALIAGAMMTFPSAKADVVLLDTVTQPCAGTCDPGDFDPQGGLYVMTNFAPFQPPNYLAAAVKFNSGSSTILTSFTAYMYNGDANEQPNALVQFHLYADNGGVPFGNNLGLVSTTAPGYPQTNGDVSTVTMTPGWAMTAGTDYWLAAVADEGALFSWNTAALVGLGGAFQSLESDPNWLPALTPVVQIFGDGEEPEEAPEPASLALMGIGLMGAAAVRRRLLAPRK